jgi:sporulation protein YlmC with PRC-barrel domain
MYSKLFVGTVVATMAWCLVVPVGAVWADACGTAAAKEVKAVKAPVAGEFTPRLAKLNHFIGMTVTDPKGEKLGVLHGVALNATEGRVVFGAVDCGKKLHPAPWGAFNVSADFKTVTLPLELAKFKEAPSFDRHVRPDMTNAAWVAEIYTAYCPKGLSRAECPAETAEKKVDPAAHAKAVAARAADLRCLTEVIGLRVKDNQGRAAGEIEHLIIDLNDGRLAYAIVSHSGSWGAGEKLSAVPWDALRTDPRTREFVLDVSRDVLLNNTYTRADFPKLADREYAMWLTGLYGTEPYWQIYAYGPAPERRIAPWLEGSVYNRSFDRENLVTIKGKILSIGSYLPTPAATPGLRLRVAGEEGNTFTVFAGPAVYWDRIDVIFRPGDVLALTASKATIGADKVLLASEIIRGDKTWMLYDAKGLPVWKANDLLPLRTPAVENPAEPMETPMELPVETPRN